MFYNKWGTSQEIHIPLLVELQYPINSFKQPQEVIKLCQFDQTSTALIKLFREKQVCDFNL